MLFVTGGAGFIGSHFVLDWIKEKGTAIVNLDKLTYAGNLQNLASIQGNPLHHFVQGDIRDAQLVRELFERFRPQAVIHFAAETHVDKSLSSPLEFVRTNVEGTAILLEEALAYWKTLEAIEKEQFRFLHVSTDEVYGSLGPQDPPFDEESPFAPNSPYAASKAASDHFVRAYHVSYGLPALISHASNNFGPFQYPEKLIPLMLLNALQGKVLPIYGDGSHLRSWIYVKDHCNALRQLLKHGKVGETYNIGVEREQTNNQVVQTLCEILGQLAPGVDYKSLVRYVKDRPGHDKRYALDCSKIVRDTGWRPLDNFLERLKETVLWYRDNTDWLKKVQNQDFRSWMADQYGEKIR